MNRKPAGFVFMVVCVILAVLLVSKVISPITSGAIFAGALAILGLASKGFTKK